MPIEETAEERIGPYRLVTRLGEGGMGVVYKGVDEAGHDVAVKVLRKEFAGDEAFRLRLQREVDTMRRIESRFVAQVLDADLQGERPYIVTRFVAGHPLDETVRATGPLSGKLLHRVATGLAEALTAIHAAGVVHRDLKPNNVMLVGGEPIVIDFGIAHAADSTRLTQTGMIIGTPGYLAPEVIDGRRAGPAVDIYAWGATVAFAATGRSPFGTGSVEAVVARIVRGQIDLSGLPQDIGDGVAATLAKEPEQRPTAEQLAGWLHRLGTPAGSPLPPSAPPMTRQVTPPPFGAAPISPVPFSPVPSSPMPLGPVPFSPVPVGAQGGLDLGWYKLIGYLFILLAVGLITELPVLLGAVFLAVAWYLRAGDGAVRSRRVPVRGWQDLLLGPLRWPGSMARSVLPTFGTLIYAYGAYLLVLTVLVAFPRNQFDNRTADGWAVAAAAYVLLAGLGVAAPRRQIVRLVSATAQDARTAISVGLIAAAVLLVVAAIVAADPSAPHWPAGSHDASIGQWRDQVQRGMNNLQHKQSTP